MKILILDDDDRRHRDFTSHLLVNHFLTHTFTLNGFIEAMSKDTFDVVFLDHDLNYEGYISKHPDGREATGYDAAVWMVKELQPEAKPKHVIVHSHNIGGAIHMIGCLKSAGYTPIYWEHNPNEHPIRAASVIAGIELDPNELARRLQNGGGGDSSTNPTKE